MCTRQSTSRSWSSTCATPSAAVKRSRAKSPTWPRNRSSISTSGASSASARKDCGTILGLEMAALKEGEDIIEPLRERIVGCVAAEDVFDPHELDEDGDKRVLVGAGQLIAEETAAHIEDAGIESVPIRSMLTCEARRGTCRMCYGRTLATIDPLALCVAV